MTPTPHNPIPMMFDPYKNWENPYKIERGGRGSSYLANFPETLDHIPKRGGGHTPFWCTPVLQA